MLTLYLITGPTAMSLVYQQPFQTCLGVIIKNESDNPLTVISLWVQKYCKNWYDQQWEASHHYVSSRDHNEPQTFQISAENFSEMPGIVLVTAGSVSMYAI